MSRILGVAVGRGRTYVQPKTSSAVQYALYALGHVLEIPLVHEAVYLARLFVARIVGIAVVRHAYEAYAPNGEQAVYVLFYQLQLPGKAGLGLAQHYAEALCFRIPQEPVEFRPVPVRTGIVVVAVYIVYLPALRVSVLSEQHLLVLYASAVRAIGLALILLGQPAVYGGPHILRLLLSICSHFSANSFLSGDRPFLNTLLHMGDFAKKQHLLYIKY